MSETSVNVEVAHKLNEKHSLREGERSNKTAFETRLEFLEVLLLAVVAIASAWSGYQSSRWDGRAAASYATAAALRIDGEERSTLGGQERLHDTSTFHAWLQAHATGDRDMTSILERRFSEDYKPAFNAWIALDPFEDHTAPAGPAFMPEYKNKLQIEAVAMHSQAAAEFESGRASAEIGEEHVRVSVFLATVLFLVAISQRFSYRAARLTLLGIALVASVLTIGLLISYPHA